MLNGECKRLKEEKERRREEEEEERGGERRREEEEEEGLTNSGKGRRTTQRLLSVVFQHNCTRISFT